MNEPKGACACARVRACARLCACVHVLCEALNTLDGVACSQCSSQFEGCCQLKRSGYPLCAIDLEPILQHEHEMGSRRMLSLNSALNWTQEPCLSRT